jgi:hypothetical protein
MLTVHHAGRKEWLWICVCAGFLMCVCGIAPPDAEGPPLVALVQCHVGEVFGEYD